MDKHRKQRNYGCRVHDQYTYLNMRTVVLENEKLRISLLLDKGTEVFEFLYKPLDMDLMWFTENGIRNPSDYLPTSPDPLSSMMDYYSGGWQVIFPNGGEPSSYKGAAFGQHGEVANMSWDCNVLEDTPSSVKVKCSVVLRKMPLRIERTFKLLQNDPHLYLEEKIDNLSDVSLPYMWGQHLAYGHPFLGPGCTIDLPDGLEILTEEPSSDVSPPGRIDRNRKQQWPNAVGVDGSLIDLSLLPDKNTPSDVCYIRGFEDKGWYKVRNSQLGLGFQVEWDATIMPFLWYWQEFGAIKDYPWYGRHYNIGLEPFSSYPTHGIQQAVDTGSAGWIGPKETKAFWLQACPFDL